MQLFYSPDFTSSDTTLTLPPTESHHAIRVLRMKEADEIFVTNGRGILIRGKISSAHEKNTRIEIEEFLEDRQKRDYRLCIGIAPTKMNERMEWFLEKVTEIGIDRIIPIICQRSERRTINHQRMEKIIVSAAKQSLKATFPVWEEATTLTEFLKTESGTTDKKFIAHCLEEGEKEEFVRSFSKGDSVCILIGPEGDFTAQEVETACRSGYRPVGLGPARLRTETAGVVAAATAALINSL